jgi:uncharacterized protein (DUF58 family)
MDFREHRAYAPGDDVRFVDWRASARQEHVFIKEGEHLKNATIYLLLDCSASMAWGCTFGEAEVSPPRSQTTLALAAALGYLALAHGDRLVVIPTGGQPLLGPVSGKGQFPGLLNYLAALHFEGQDDLGQVMAGLARRSLSRGGLVLALSDLLGVGDLSRALEALPAPRWGSVLLHLLHPAELDPQARGDLELYDIETGQRRRHAITDKVLETYRQRLRSWLDSLETACQGKTNAIYSLIQTNWSLDREILPRLRSANVVKAL